MVRSATQAGGKALLSVSVHDVIRLPAGDDDSVIFDEMRIGTNPMAVVTAPRNGNLVSSNTPDITWTKAYPLLAPTNVQVRVCTSDNPNGTAEWDSTAVPWPGSPSLASGALEWNVQRWAFVREEYSTTGWTGWSPMGNGGFTCNGTPPNPPTMIAFSPNPHVGLKPMIAFTGDAHDSIQVKITTDSAGNDVVWDSTPLSSTYNGVACSNVLTENTTYYAFAKIGNNVALSAWSSPTPSFTVTRTGVVRDTRHMSEQIGMNNILGHVGLAPNDGFGTVMFGDPNVNWTRFRTGIVNNCENKWALFEHQADQGSISCQLRKHRVSSIDLDKGVTLTSGFMILDGQNLGSAVEVWADSNFVINDHNAGPSHTDQVMASFRIDQGRIGICSNGTTWKFENAPIGNDWNIMRITGRNKFKGDCNSTEWKVYLNEATVPVNTATGSVSSSVVLNNAWMSEDCIGIGDGAHARTGCYMYDYTDVNGSGDYTPSEWGGIASVTASSIGAAKDGGMTTLGTPMPVGLEVKNATIADNGFSAIITKDIGTSTYFGYHGYAVGSGPAYADQKTTVHAYQVQDGSGAIGIMSDPATAAGVAEGKKVTSISARIQQAMSTQEYWHEANSGEEPVGTGYGFMHYRPMGD